MNKEIREIAKSVDIDDNVDFVSHTFDHWIRDLRDFEK